MVYESSQTQENEIFSRSIICAILQYLQKPLRGARDGTSVGAQFLFRFFSGKREGFNQPVEVSDERPEELTRPTDKLPIFIVQVKLLHVLTVPPITACRGRCPKHL